MNGPSDVRARAKGRLCAVDWMRGLVMVLMTTDHASDAFDRGHLMTDATFMYSPGTPLPVANFLARWITHLCAPTFVFLAGTALALSVTKRAAKGESAKKLDAFIVARGLFIAAIDPLWMSRVFTPGKVLLQVMYAIGTSMIAMAALRRLPVRLLVAVALATLLGAEALMQAVRASFGAEVPWLFGLLLSGGRYGTVLVAYPTLHWLAIMMLGWAFGVWLASSPEPHRVARSLAVWGGGALVAFLLVRGANGYGNMQLFRDDTSLVQWLHVSKYPPSATFVLLELGCMALLLAAFFAFEAREGAVGVRASAPFALQALGVFGQTALLFYVLHAHLLHYGAELLDLSRKLGLFGTYVASAVVLLLLYPVCVAYGRYKRTHANVVTRFV